MGTSRDDQPTSVAELLAGARSVLRRLTPAEALAEQAAGAVIVDIRPSEQRLRDGELPNAVIVSRNVAEWRLDPSCAHRDPALAYAGRRVIIACDEGFQSSILAATVRRFGLDATDVIGGVQGWIAAGLSLAPARGLSTPPQHSPEELLGGAARGPVIDQL